MYEISESNVPRIHFPNHITDFKSTGTNLRSLSPSNSLRFNIAKQFIADSLKLGKGECLSISTDMKIITSNWDFISKQIWGVNYPITLSDSSYSGDPISKIEAYNMVSLLSGNSEKAMTKPGDNEDLWAKKRRSNRKNQLSSTVEETTDFAVEASSFTLGSQNLDVDLVFAAGWADKIHGFTVPADGSYHVQTLQNQLCVAGQIITLNIFLLMFARKVGPALTCGNSTVLKTAEKTPLSALYAGNLFLEAGFPPSVLNVISGFGHTAGAALCSHKDVHKLAFTGSTATGKTVLALTAANNLKRVTLELGKKYLFIVCEDADIDKAAELMHFVLFYRQGLAAGVFTHNLDVTNTLARALKAGTVYVVCLMFLMLQCHLEIRGVLLTSLQVKAVLTL